MENFWLATFFSAAWTRFFMRIREMKMKEKMREWTRYCMTWNIEPETV